MSKPNLTDLKAAYARNENITQILRGPSGTAINDQASILISYDLQAGSYIEALHDPAHRQAVARYADAVAQTLAPLRPRSLLEPGTGEATMLSEILRRLSLPEGSPVRAFDISWSRVHLGRGYLGAKGQSADLFAGELEAIALPDDAADVVFTSHAVEPNHGREAEILAELYRVTGRFLVLFEPSYEFASPEARARMEEHRYCRGLPDIAEKLGGKVRKHKLLGTALNPLNPTGVLVVEKQPLRGVQADAGFACPSCRAALLPSEGAFFCKAEGLAYPVLRGIPCLCRHNAVLASRYLE